MKRGDDNGARSPKATRAALIGWAFYDWANNAFATVILTFVFSAYFTRRVAPDGVAGSVLWGNMVGIAGLCVALGGPICGAAADHNGRRKPWLAAFTLACVLATSMLWFIEPSADFLWPALILVGIGMVAAEHAAIFYNAMLPQLVPRESVGRWSGRGWGLGYAGGLACLLTALLIMREDGAPDALLPIRATFLLAAAWYLVFALPLFLLVPDTRGKGKPPGRAVGDGIGQIVQTLKQVRRFKGLALFLAARMIYIDALATIFALGGVYAAGVFGMSEREVLLFGVVLNITAGLGALVFAPLDDKIGPKRTILASLAGLIVGAALILAVHSLLFFWLAGAFLGLFVGPVQAASRSYMARAAPAEMRHQMFGLYAFSGKATAFLGPFLVGWLAAIFDSQRIGMTVIVVLLAVGAVLMCKVPDSD